MAFNPTLPLEGSEIDAAELRAQFNALNDLIAAQTARIDSLELALSHTAQNPNLSPLNLTLNDPPTKDQVIEFVNAFNALLNQITRV